MLTQPKLENREQQYYAAIRTAVPIPFGRYLQPLWDEVNGWLKSQGITSPGPAIIRYLTTDMSKKLDIDVGFAVDQPIAGNDRIIVDVLPAVNMPRFYTPDLIEAKVSIKRMWR